nr:MAG TPA: hypothetical protein [Caudoviricetes sp.]
MCTYGIEIINLYHLLERRKLDILLSLLINFHHTH